MTKESLGVKINFEPGKAMLSQSYYIEKSLQSQNMQSCKPCSTPMDRSQLYRLTVRDEPTVEEKSKTAHIPYRDAICQLLYLSGRTRPDIAFAVGILTCHVSKRKHIHWAAVKKNFWVSGRNF